MLAYNVFYKQSVWALGGGIEMLFIGTFAAILG